jgi:hypothetical protein
MGQAKRRGMKLHQEIYENNYIYAQKNMGAKLVHLKGGPKHKVLCGADNILAFFKPVSGWPICKKCMKIYNTQINQTRKLSRQNSTE